MAFCRYFKNFFSKNPTPGRRLLDIKSTILNHINDNYQCNIFKMSQNIFQYHQSSKLNVNELLKTISVVFSERRNNLISTR